MATYKLLSKVQSSEGNGVFTIELEITTNNGNVEISEIINNNPNGVFDGIPEGIVSEDNLEAFYQAYANTFDN